MNVQNPVIFQSKNNSYLTIQLTYCRQKHKSPRQKAQIYRMWANKQNWAGKLLLLWNAPGCGVRSCVVGWSKTVSQPERSTAVSDGRILKQLNLKDPASSDASEGLFQRPGSSRFFLHTEIFKDACVCPRCAWSTHNPLHTTLFKNAKFCLKFWGLTQHKTLWMFACFLKYRYRSIIG